MIYVSRFYGEENSNDETGSKKKLKNFTCTISCKYLRCV